MRQGRVETVATLALLAAVTLATRLPFLTPRLAHWDAVNYALGLHDFDVAAHQPHPPGSPYFILLGRAALAVTGDDNQALILVSLVASAGAVLALYALARVAFGSHAAGGLAAVLLMTQPIFWGYGTMATSWTLLALLAVLVSLSCLLILQGQRRLIVTSAVLMGVASGLRLDVTVFVLPLWVWTVWRADPSRSRRWLAIAMVPALVLVWLIPVAVTAGGLSEWSERLVALLPTTEASPGQLARQLASNTAISFGTLAFTLGPAVVLSLLVDPRGAGKSLRTTWHSKLGVFWLLWIGPAFVFLWLVDSTEPGHDLVFAPALCALGAGLLVQVTCSAWRTIVPGAVVVALQSAVFLFASPLPERPLAWTANSMLLNVTAPGLRAQQRSLDEALSVIRARFDPRDTVVVTVIGQDPYRFMMYYLPDYAVLRLDPPMHTVLEARTGHQGKWTPAPDCLFGSGVRHTVWVLWSRSEPGLVPSGATYIPTDDPEPFRVWHLQLSPDTPDYLGFALGGNCAPS